jgi:HSP20 family molecular chaperone IbpA
MNPRTDQGWMWADACALLDQAERLHRRFFRLLAASSAQPAWEPPVNVFRTDRDWLIVVALPGAEADSVNIELRGTGIEIAAFAATPALPYRAGIERLEIPYGRMRRRINLPAGHYTLMERRLANGCLHLRLSEERR